VPSFGFESRPARAKRARRWGGRRRDGVADHGTAHAMHPTIKAKTAKTRLRANMNPAASPRPPQCSRLRDDARVDDGALLLADFIV